MGAKSQPISPPFGHKAGLPPSKKYLIVRQPHPFFLWEILLKVSAEKKDPSGRITLRGKNCAICDSYDGAVYDRKKWNVKWKNFYFT